MGGSSDLYKVAEPQSGQAGVCGPSDIILETVIGRQVPPCAARGRGRRCVPVLLSIKQAAAG